jgi:small subunit ribosomal protein S20
MIRVAAKKRQRSQPVRTLAKTSVDKAEKLMAARQAETAQAAVVEAISALDKAAEKGILHKNNAARRKSRLMKKLNALQAPKPATA